MAGIGIRTEMNEPEDSTYGRDIIKYYTKICTSVALTVVSDPLLKWLMKNVPKEKMERWTPSSEVGMEPQYFTCSYEA